jgi:hypothetical protein
MAEPALYISTEIYGTVKYKEGGLKHTFSNNTYTHLPVHVK